MLYKTMTIDAFLDYAKDKPIYLFGVGGSFYSMVEINDIILPRLKTVKYIIDNKKTGQYRLNSKAVSIYHPDVLKTEIGGIILICSPDFAYEMANQLDVMNLPDTFECFCLPMMFSSSKGESDPVILAEMDRRSGNKHSQKIDKTIHTFWFSNDKIPDKYQQCIDSWKRVCPDYQIHIWSKADYDIEKSSFMKKACEKKKWAFASDYSRLDVIYHHGGIYFDMDVELINRPDPLLNFRSFFAFSPVGHIDTGSGFGSIPQNDLLKNIMDIYDMVSFPDKTDDASLRKLIPPFLEKECYEKAGIQMNGKMQLINDMLILPRQFFSPVSNNCFDIDVIGNETIGIHHYIDAWRDGVDIRERRKNNKALTSRFMNI